MTNHEDEDRRGHPFARHTNEALRAVIGCPERDALIQAREDISELGPELSNIGELILSAIAGVFIGLALHYATAGSLAHTRKEEAMKAIIDRKLYDTETAEELAEWTNGISPSDFRWEVETLYRTPRGALFLHGRGGALSSYSRSVGNERHGSETIKPLTEDEAIDWLETKQLAEELLLLFPDAVEDA